MDKILNNKIHSFLSHNETKNAKLKFAKNR